jgi:hypothetical protein
VTEIADLCSWRLAEVTLSDGQLWVMQSLWDNAVGCTYSPVTTTAAGSTCRGACAGGSGGAPQQELTARHRRQHLPQQQDVLLRRLQRRVQLRSRPVLRERGLPARHHALRLGVHLIQLLLLQ